MNYALTYGDRESELYLRADNVTDEFVVPQFGLPAPGRFLCAPVCDIAGETGICVFVITQLAHARKPSRAGAGMSVSTYTATGSGISHNG